MTDWTAGYVADIGYTFGYYTELNPLRAQLAFLNAGYSLPRAGTACELGFGQGMSININAAASPVRWYGTDFNPSQAAFAQELASVSGSGAHVADQAFAEFCNRTDLPDFDFIGLHGIWSWISDENRAVIVDFVRRKLKVGGVLYISYNTQPGWASMVPVRDLLTEYSEVMGAPGQGIVARIDGALDFADKLMATNPSYLRLHPHIKERLGKIKDQDRHYIAHEYFNRDWHPMPFSRMADWLAPAKVGYACSANYAEHIDAINLTGEQQKFLDEVPDAMFRETVRDFMINQQFRKDYWVKGGRKLAPLERLEAIRQHKIMLAIHRSRVTLKISGALGEADMTESVYGPILDVLADYKPKTLGEIEQATKEKGLDMAKVLQAALVLTSQHSLASVQDDEVIARARPACDRLNLHLVNKARSSSKMHFLASPVTGGGIALARFDQLFLLARMQGKNTPQEWAQFVWQVLSAQGQRLRKENQTLDTDQDNLAELDVLARDFGNKTLPLLKGLGIAA